MAGRTHSDKKRVKATIRPATPVAPLKWVLSVSHVLSAALHIMVMLALTYLTYSLVVGASPSIPEVCEKLRVSGQFDVLGKCLFSEPMPIPEQCDEAWQAVTRCFYERSL